jgi:hypothetical protein
MSLNHINNVFKKSLIHFVYDYATVIIYCRKMFMKLAVVLKYGPVRTEIIVHIMVPYFRPDS